MSFPSIMSIVFGLYYIYQQISIVDFHLFRFPFHILATPSYIISHIIITATNVLYNEIKVFLFCFFSFISFSNTCNHIVFISYMTSQNEHANVCFYTQNDNELINLFVFCYLYKTHNKYVFQIFQSSKTLGYHSTVYSSQWN